MRKQKGFSLIELLIVVAIILIIAAIAIPNLLRSRIAANEASAVGSIRTINTAEVTYASTYPNMGFGGLPQLGPSADGTVTSAAGGLIDSVLASSVKSGYVFAVVTGTASGGVVPSYAVNGDPQNSQTGQRHFCSDQSGVIRYDVATKITSTGDTGCTTGSPLQ
ncbi:MAG: prepilin-type N-terminal cleavage/methylation domain-containing protein [Acidobacteriia bacterium]|nr:prepilin-type N-terminal cleavage/methylation domain-containing protein [Terriglobia bacterium]